MKQRGQIRTQLSMRSAVILMAAVSVARGSSFIFSKQLLAGGMEPLNLLGVRSLIAFAVLMLFFWRRVIESVRADHHNLTAGILIGFVYFLVMTLELNGLKHTNAATASFLENSAIVLVPLGEMIIFRRLLTGKALMCCALSLTGIGFIAAKGFVRGLGTGEFLCIAAAVLYTAAIIITDRAAKKYDPFVVGILYVGAMGAFGQAGSFATETPHLPQTGSQWLMILMLAVVCSSFGFAMQPVAQKTISSETAGILIALNPLTTAVLGITVLRETFGMNDIIGATLIIGGIALHNMPEGREKAGMLSNLSGMYLNRRIYK